MLLARAVSYRLRSDGTLDITLNPDWDGTPRLSLFPSHVRRTLEGRPLLADAEETDKLRTARCKSAEVYAAVWDDLQCLRATKLLVDSWPRDAFTLEAVQVFPDYPRERVPQWFKDLTQTPAAPDAESQTLRVRQLIDGVRRHLALDNGPEMETPDRLATCPHCDEVQCRCEDGLENEGAEEDELAM